MKLLTVGIAVMLALGVSSTGFATTQKNTRTKLADNSSSTIAPAPTTDPVATPNNASSGAQTSAQAQAATTQPAQADAQQGQSEPQATNSQDKDDDSDKD